MESGGDVVVSEGEVDVRTSRVVGTSQRLMQTRVHRQTSSSLLARQRTHERLVLTFEPEIKYVKISPFFLQIK